MVSGYDKSGIEYTPPREPRSWQFRLMCWCVFLASAAVGALLASLAK